MMVNKYHDLIADRDFENLRIERPRSLESETDEKLMLQYFISKFYMSINVIRKAYGYEARQRTLYVMAKLIGYARKLQMTYGELESEMIGIIIDCSHWAADKSEETA